MRARRSIAVQFLLLRSLSWSLDKRDEAAAQQFLCDLIGCYGLACRRIAPNRHIHIPIFIATHAGQRFNGPYVEVLFGWLTAIVRSPTSTGL